MILLDSDHLSVLRFRTSPRAVRLSARLAACGDDRIGTTIANVEESMRGWLAALAKEREVRRQIAAYRELADLFTFFSGYHIACSTTRRRIGSTRSERRRCGSAHQI